LLKTETGSGVLTNTPVQTQETKYNFASPYQIGTSIQTRSSSYVDEVQRQETEKTTALDGATFKWAAATFDEFAQPLTVTRSSSLGYSKSEEMTYHNDKTKWIIGQLKSLKDVATNTMELTKTFDATTSTVTSQTVFGALQGNYLWNTDGTLQKATDALGRATTLSSYFRGIPRRIDSPDATFRTGTVDNNGWLTALTDQLGNSTSFQYDAMGRLSGITYPTADTTVWNNSTFSFAPSSVAAYGLPAGHWKRTAQTGNALTTTLYNGQWQPVLVITEDITNAATRSFVVKRYDTEGREVFTSYPVATLTSVNDTLTGTRNFYDALGRVTKVEQDSELGVLSSTTEYLAGFQTKVTNPRGIATTTKFQAFDSPDTSRPMWIATAEGTADAQYTEMTRDVFGRTLTQRRRNADSTQQQTRQYVYDSFGRVCKKLEPETGASLFDYDAVGNLIWSVQGSALNTATCDRASVAAADKTVNTYNNMNRVTAVDAPNGTDGDKNYFYDADGALNRIQTWSNGAEINNRYFYNKRRLLISESSEQVGWYNWPLLYSYDANANLNRVTYPTGFYVDYAPNALGQATTATSPQGTWASNISYYPNGAVKQFTYGNGIVHTMTQNARQLPSRITAGAAMDNEYTYEANGNVERILEHRGGYHRWMGYDGLDRLTSVAAAAFGGNERAYYTYDVFDNLKRSTLGLAGFTYHYDTANRVNRIDRDGGGSYNYTHTAKGEVQNDGRNAYQWDSSGRIVGINDAANTVAKETYRYDGENRRVLAWAPSGNIVSMYGKNGQILFQSNGREMRGYEYVYLNDDLLATRETVSATTINTRYQHTDILGSPVAETDQAGNVIQRTEYAPFGNPLNRAVSGVGYTGHVMDSATNLTYMQQRYYDPLVGRFLSTDPVQTDMNTGYMFNRYYYANNNPFKFVDPDGRQSARPDDVRAPVSTGLGPFADWLASSSDTRGSSGQMMQDQLRFELSRPRSWEENLQYVAIAMSFGVGLRLPIGGGSVVRGGTPRPAAGLGSIRPTQAARIQQIVNRHGVNVDVIGSRARGNAHADSDWDYVITGGTSRARSKAFKDLPRGKSGGDLDGSGNWTGKERIDPSKVYPDEPRVRFTPKVNKP
jgi:RHS repeat-associated protein